MLNDSNGRNDQADINRIHSNKVDTFEAFRLISLRNTFLQLSSSLFLSKFSSSRLPTD